MKEGRSSIRVGSMAGVTFFERRGLHQVQRIENLAHKGGFVFSTGSNDIIDGVQIRVDEMGSHIISPRGYRS